MPPLVPSASGANGSGFDALLSFELDGRLRGTLPDKRRRLSTLRLRRRHVGLAQQN